MKRKKFSIFITLLISVIVFSTAAVCNQCTLAQPAATEKVGIESTGTTATGITTAQTTAETKAGTAATTAATAATAATATTTVTVETIPSQTLAVQENHNPIINAFLSPTQNTLAANQSYDFIVQAQDPDGDILEFNWTVNPNIGVPPAFNPKEAKMNWFPPSIPGNYTITVIATDGRGGQAAMSMIITISCIAFEKNMPVIISEGGSAAYQGVVDNGSYIYAGDSFDNKFWRGFVSFDITGLKGGVIKDAVFSLNSRWIIGNPSFFNPLYANLLYWGARPITQSDFGVTGTVIPSTNAGGAYPSNEQNTQLFYRAEQLLQNAIDAGWERFQVRIQFTGDITNNDSVADGWRFEQANAELKVSTKN